MCYLSGDGRRARVGKGAPRRRGRPAPPGCRQREKEPLRKSADVSPVGTSDRRWRRRAPCYGALARAHPQAHDKEPGDPDDGDRSADSGFERRRRTSARELSYSSAIGATRRPCLTPLQRDVGQVPARGHLARRQGVRAHHRRARAPRSALNGSTAARRNTPDQRQGEQEARRRARGKPMVFDEGCSGRHRREQGRKIQGDNDNLRELNRKLMEQLAPPDSPRRRRRTPPRPSPSGARRGRRAAPAPQRGELRAPLAQHQDPRPPQDAQQSARESADASPQVGDQRAEALKAHLLQRGVHSSSAI